MKDLNSFIRLNLIDQLGYHRIKLLVESFGSAEAVFSASVGDLKKIKGIGEQFAELIVKSTALDLNKELELVKKHKINVISIKDLEYPKNLANIYSPPCVLYVKGQLVETDVQSVAVVGSRRASYYGIDMAEKIAYKLASRGITVVSGLARGIDTAAHKGALKAGGRTIAVLGSGLVGIYPPENKDLAELISKSGAVITEFPMESIPHKSHFPRRNRIISGCSLGVVVIEAAARSGSLITADFALEQGREVFSVPGKVGSVTSMGTNNLIKQGAKLVSCIEDIIEELPLKNLTDYQLKEKQENILEKKEEKVLFNLKSEPVNIDVLSEITGISVNLLSGILLKLQLKGMARELPGKEFIKVNLTI